MLPPCEYCAGAIKIIAGIEDLKSSVEFSSICSAARSPTRRYLLTD
jgi:hypothetical protein